MPGQMKEILKSSLLGVLGVRQRIRSRTAVLLTFDDGPQPGVTEAILDRLRQHRVRAVFFSIGYQVERAGHLLEQVHADGHQIGNHTFAHPREPPRSVAAALDDLRRCQSIIASRTGSAPRLYRPPLGSIHLPTLWAAHRLSLTTLLWSVDSLDWQIKSREEADQRGRVLARTVVPGDIVLLHEHNEHVLTILDVLLPALATQGVDLASGVDLL